MLNDILSELSGHISSLPINGHFIYYPDMKAAFGSGQAPPTDKPISQWYASKGDATERVGDFYVGLSNYLKTSSEVMDIPRKVGAGLGEMLYYVASGLQFFYVKMFKLFDITSGRYGYGEFNKIFRWMNDFGLAVFAAMVAAYAIGMIINSPGWARHKRTIRNGILIVFFLFCVPAGTSALTSGIQSAATGLLGNNMSKEKGPAAKHKNVDSIASIPDDIFRHNIVSVPIKLEHMKPGKGISQGHHVFQERRISNADIGGIPVHPLMVDLDNMPAKEVDSWNGLEGESVPRFLSVYSGNNDLLENDTLSNLHKQVEKKTEGKNHQHATDYYQREKYYHPHSYWLNFGTWEGAALNDDQAEGLINLLSYQPLVTGNGAGGTYMQKLSGAASGGHITQALRSAYTMYDVNWFAIYAGLIMLIAILGVYIYKTVCLLFKLGVMYVTSGVAMFRNANNPQRIKAWARDFFSIYEALLIDIVMIRVVLTLYIVVNGFNSNLLMHSSNFAIANPWTIALVDLIGDYALFRASSRGVNALNTMIGSSGGGANTGHFGMGSFLALRGAESGAKALGKLASSPVRGVRDALGKKGSLFGQNGKLSELARRNTKGGLIHSAREQKALERARKQAGRSQRTNGKKGSSKLGSKKPGDGKNRSNRNQGHRTGMNNKTSGNKSANDKGGSQSLNSSNSSSRHSDDNQPDDTQNDSQNGDQGDGQGDSDDESGSDLANDLNDDGNQDTSARRAAEAGAAGGFAFHRMSRRGGHGSASEAPESQKQMKQAMRDVSPARRKQIRNATKGMSPQAKRKTQKAMTTFSDKSPADAIASYDAAEKAGSRINDSGSDNGSTQQDTSTDSPTSTDNTKSIVQDNDTSTDNKTANQGDGPSTSTDNNDGGSAPSNPSSGPVRNVREDVGGTHTSATHTTSTDSYQPTQGPVNNSGSSELGSGQNSNNGNGGSTHTTVHVHNHRQIHNVHIRQHHQTTHTVHVSHHRPKFNFMNRPHNR